MAQLRLARAPPGRSLSCSDRSSDRMVAQVFDIWVASQLTTRNAGGSDREWHSWTNDGRFHVVG